MRKYLNKIIYFLQGDKCYCGNENLFKDADSDFLVMEDECQACEIREDKCSSEKCQQFSPFTCGNSQKDLMSVYCNPDKDNCLSFNSPAELDLKSHNANFSYFGCVKKPDGKDFSSGKKLGIECLKYCAQIDKVMALMRPGFTGIKKE